jgi:probable phosphoglycerate mutase
MSDRGEMQALHAAMVLKTARVSCIFASPIGRALATAEVVGKNLNLPVSIDLDLQEVDFGVEEGKPAGGWYNQWIAGEHIPLNAEPFASLLARAVAAVNRATSRDDHNGMPLIVGHGAWFRAIRLAMHLEPNIRTAHGVPMACRPPTDSGTGWTISTIYHESTPDQG